MTIAGRPHAAAFTILDHALDALRAAAGRAPGRRALALSLGDLLALVVTIGVSFISRASFASCSKENVLPRFSLARGIRGDLGRRQLHCPVDRVLAALSAAGLDFRTHHSVARAFSSA